MSIASKLQELVTLKNSLKTNLVTQGVDVGDADTLTTLVPKVLDIETGGGFDTGSWIDVFMFGKHHIAVNSTRSEWSASDINAKVMAIPDLYNYFKTYNNADIFIRNNYDTSVTPAIRSGFTIWIIGYSDDKTSAIGRVQGFTQTGYTPSYNGRAVGSGTYADVVAAMFADEWSPDPGGLDTPTRTFTGIADN